MAYDVKGKRVLVTGASAGIGAELATAFAARGATVGICARRDDRLAGVLAACREHSPDSRSWVVDLSDLDAVTGFAERADDELGGIDVVVNNAGMPKRKRLDAVSLAEIDAVMALNYLSPVRIIKALVPRMVERGGGHVVNISSVAARLSPPGEAAYAASKAALSTFTECIAIELWDTPVRFHLVNPGVIDTELFDLPDNDPLVAPIERLPASVITDAVLAQLEHDEFEVYVPEWFGDIARGKAADIPAFLAGSAAWLRDQAVG